MAEHKHDDTEDFPLDSRQFGFVNLEENLQKKKFLEQELAKLEDLLKSGGNYKKISDIKSDPKVYSKLGHINLLLHNYHKALIAYQQYHKMEPKYWSDAPFLYGLGIVYFHFNALQSAVKSFQQVLYSDPSFCRANEVHLRLGFIFKITCSYDLSLKHFQLALLDCGKSSVSKGEIQYHIAHVNELLKNYKLAKESYEVVANNPDNSKCVRAGAFRQLGWLIHTTPERGVVDTDTAIEYLNKSLKVDEHSGLTHYLLGRCYSDVGRIQKAFVAYRYSIDKTENSADTWCSIGVLYQQQNQPMDALQAYICAVQLDRNHPTAWFDLGVLYESVSQYKDSLTCYLNAERTGNAKLNSCLPTRVRLLQEYVNSDTDTSKITTLPAIEEAWSLPIPQELTSRQVMEGKTGEKRPHVMLNGMPDVKKQRLVDGVGSNFGFSVYQSKVLKHLQQNKDVLKPDQIVSSWLD